MKLIFTAFILSFSFISCSKRECNFCQTADYFNATIIEGSPVEADGCGWLIRIDNNQYYHPNTLKEEFRQSNLNVQVCFIQTTEKFYCGIAGTNIPVIRILDIKK